METSCSVRPERPVDHWQFSLRELLAITTFAAFAAALAAAKGMGIFVVAVALGVCYLNYRGALARWQRGTWPWLWVAMSWGLFAGSLAVNAVAVEYCVEGRTTADWLELYGWEAALVSFNAQFDLSLESVGDLFNFLYFSFFNLANLLLALSPFWAWRLSRGRGDWYGALAAASAVVVWCAALWLRAYAGYYLWALANLTLLSAWRIRRPALIAMALTAAFFVGFAVIGGTE